MQNYEILAVEMIAAIHSFRAGKLSLGGLVNRLEELVAELSKKGIKWTIDIDEILLQLEIINSLVATEGALPISSDDVRDIGGYLESIEAEVNSHLSPAVDQ
jgi:hypothetical protein